MNHRKQIVITGCQRSGTTLMHLVLDSHPLIKGIDESVFDYADYPIYLMTPARETAVSYKLPRYAPVLDFLRSSPDRRVIWCVRDPLDVVASMLKLELPLREQVTVPWAVHPLCGQKEIVNCLHVLPAGVRTSIEPWLEQYKTVLSIPPESRDRQAIVLAAALCWCIKNELPDVYRHEGIDHHVLAYEAVVSNTEDTLRNLMTFIGIGWHDDLLRHHEKHRGESIGRTSNTRAIDSRGVGRGRDALSDAEISMVASICSRTAVRFGYELTG